MITGGSGFIGNHLSKTLKDKGFIVTHLSRKPDPKSEFKQYQWDIDNDLIDPVGISSANHIIHLAGAGIGDKRWTESRKKELVDSRIKSAALLGRCLAELDHHVKSVISSSGIAYYGDGGDTLLVEDSFAADDFLGNLCVSWENEIQKINVPGIRTASIRTGVVISRDSEAIRKITPPLNFGMGPLLLTGKMYFPWIHLQDLVSMYVYAIKNPEISGSYNAVAPDPVIYKDFIKGIAKVRKRAVFLLPTPLFALKIALGELAGYIVYSTKVSPNKIISNGFQFKYPDLESALEEIFN